MGDGSARLSAVAPGYVDDAARAWQDRVVAALATADVQVLGDLDREGAQAQLASGRLPWLVAAAACDDPDEEGRLDVVVHGVEERYGVGYVAAAWVRR